MKLGGLLFPTNCAALVRRCAPSIVSGMKPRETHVGPITDDDEFRTFLGPLAADYTDNQLRDLQRDMHVATPVLLTLQRFDTSRGAH